MNVGTHSIPEDAPLPTRPLIPTRSWTSKMFGWVGGAVQNRPDSQTPIISVLEQHTGNTPTQTPDRTGNFNYKGDSLHRTGSSAQLSRTDVSLTSSDISYVR